MVKSLKSKFIIYLLPIFIIIVIVVINNYQNKFLTKIFPGKIWIHRVNSIEKLVEVTTEFNQVELDVVYMPEKNCFDVNHPPAESINLTLLEYLKSIKLDSEHKFWLDYKNLLGENMQASCLRLDSICNLLRLNPNQFIVESPQPEYLKGFKEKGFKVSYYLPGNLLSLSEAEMNSIKKKDEKFMTDYVSADKLYYNLMKNTFMNRKILTWGFQSLDEKMRLNTTFFERFNLLIEKYQILSDDEVQVVLFEYNVKIGNR